MHGHTVTCSGCYHINIFCRWQTLFVQVHTHTHTHTHTPVTPTVRVVEIQWAGTIQQRSLNAWPHIIHLPDVSDTCTVGVHVLPQTSLVDEKYVYIYREFRNRGRGGGLWYLHRTKVRNSNSYKKKALQQNTTQHSLEKTLKKKLCWPSLSLYLKKILWKKTLKIFSLSLSLSLFLSLSLSIILIGTTHPMRNHPWTIQNIKLLTHIPIEHKLSIQHFPYIYAYILLRRHHCLNWMMMDYTVKTLNTTKYFQRWSAYICQCWIFFL